MKERKNISKSKSGSGSKRKLRTEDPASLPLWRDYAGQAYYIEIEIGIGIEKKTED